MRPSAHVTSSCESDVWTLLQNSGLTLSWQQTQGCLRKQMSLEVVPSAHAFQP